MSRLITMGAVLMLAACPLGTAHSQTQTARQLSSIIVINSNNVSINRNSVGNNEVGGPQDWGIGIVNSTNVVMRSNSYENLPPINGNFSLPQNHYATSTSEVERINDPAN